MYIRLTASLFVLFCSVFSLFPSGYAVAAQQITPTTIPSPQPVPTIAPIVTPSLEERITELEKHISSLEEKPKDVWDILNSVSGLISGGLVAVIGIIATYIYNDRQTRNSADQKQRELKILRVQTVHNFMPQLQSEDPKTVELALLAITALDDTKLATDLASLIRTKGAISALEKIASSPNQDIAKIAKQSLSSLYETLSRSVVEIHGPNGLIGAGFFGTDDGYIVTADFVVSLAGDKDKILIVIGDISHEAKISYVIPETNLALLKVDNGRFPSLRVVENPRADYHEDVFLLAPNPHLGGWATATGKITAKDIHREEIEGIDLIGTDAQLQPGYAGAPVVNQYGQVVGMAISSCIGGTEGTSTSLLIPASYIFQILNRQNTNKS